MLLLGMCEQLFRGPAAGAGCYIYAGSLGLLSTDDIPQRTFHQAQQIGTAIANWLGIEGPQITGLFGIDFILDENSGDLWTLEVNPRYPASAELYERASGWPMIRWHVDVCRRSVLPSASYMRQVGGGKSNRKHGKLILYARHDFEATEVTVLVKRLFESDCDRLTVADIPHPGTWIRKDQPICTILMAHETLTGCREALVSAGAALLTAIESLAK